MILMTFSENVNATRKKAAFRNLSQNIFLKKEQMQPLSINGIDRKKELQVLRGLERLRPEWNQILDGAEKWLYQENEETYKNICKEFHQMYGALSNYKEEWENVGEQLMMFFVYTYFCGAVYDDMVCSKMEMALFSIRWVQEFLIVRWLENGKTLSMKDVEEISWRYAREVEHSDNNLNTLEDWLFENYYLIH